MSLAKVTGGKWWSRNWILESLLLATLLDCEFGGNGATTPFPAVLSRPVGSRAEGTRSKHLCGKGCQEWRLGTVKAQSAENTSSWSSLSLTLHMAEIFLVHDRVYANFNPHIFPNHSAAAFCLFYPLPRIFLVERFLKCHLPPHWRWSLWFKLTTFL